MNKATPASGWLTTFQHKLQSYPAWSLDLCIYGIFGLIAGFLCKTVGRYLFLGVVSIIAVLWLFSSAGFVTVNVAQLKAFFGLSSVHTIDDLLHLYIEWIRAHLIGGGAFIVGFFSGWKLS